MESKRSYHLLWISIACLLIGLLLAGAGRRDSVLAAHAAPIAHAVPGQFIAKIYTEALGRMPTQAEWQYWVDTFTNSLDCEQTVKDTVYQFYTSPDFLERYPDREAQLLALSRGALTEEIVQDWFNHYVSGDWPSRPWNEVVSDFLFVTRARLFDSIAHDACELGDPPWYQNAPYYWRNTPVSNIGWAGPPDDPWVYHGRSGSELQQLLYAAQGQTSTVFLAQRVAVLVTTTLVIPEGITLTTWHEGDSPPLSPERYAVMGRLVRASRFGAPVVVLQSCSTLRGVWVDGQEKRLGYRRELPPRPISAVNVQIQDGGDRPGCQTRLVENRLSDPLGWTQVHVLGSGEGYPCGQVYIARNLLTGYANMHPFPGSPWTEWADGLSVGCEHTIVESNQLVDVTDVGVVVFRAGKDVTQETIVRNNVMLNAGNSAFGGFGTNPLYPIPCSAQTQEYDFSGTRIEGNVIWTSPTAHIDAVLKAGAYAIVFPCPYHNWARGAAFLGNTTGNREVCPSCMVRTNSPIIVSGMFDALVQYNDLRAEIENFIECHYPGKDKPGESIILASVGTGWASFQEPVPVYTDVRLWECVRHVEKPISPLYRPVMASPYPTSWYYLPLVVKAAGQEALPPLPPPAPGDTTPPVTTRQLDGTPGRNGWYVSAALIPPSTKPPTAWRR
jgi:hypothetical protein